MPLPADLQAPNHVSQTILEVPLTEYPSPRSHRHRSTSGHSLPLQVHCARAPAVWVRLLCTAKVDSVNKTCSRWPGWGTRFAAGDSFLEAQRSWCGGLQLRTQSCKWWKRVPPAWRGTRFGRRGTRLEAQRSCCGGLQLRTQSCKWWKRVPPVWRGTRFATGVAAGDSFLEALVAAVVGFSYEPNLVNGGNESLPSGGGLVSRRSCGGLVLGSAP